MAKRAAMSMSARPRNMFCHTAKFRVLSDDDDALFDDRAVVTS